MGLLFHRVVVDGFVGIEAVGDHVEPLARHVQRHAVGQVTAFGQAHAHDGVARLGKGHEHGLVGLRAAVGLHVGRFSTEQLFDAVNGQLFDHIHMLAAAVVALAGVAFGVFIGQLRALGFHDGGGAVVFAGDQLNVLLLALVFGLDGGKYFGIDNLNGIGTLEHSVNGSCGDESLRTSLRVAQANG